MKKFTGYLNTRIHQIAALIVEHPVPILIGMAVITLGFMGLTLPRLQQDHSMDKFFQRDDPDNVFREEFTRQFGNDEFFVIAFRDDHLFSPPVLHLIQHLTSQLEEMEEVQDVISLTNVEDITGGEMDFSVTPFITDIPQSRARLDSLKDAARSNPLYRKLLVSEDGNATAIVVRIFDRPDDDLYRERLLTKVKSLLRDIPRETFYLAGTAVSNFEIANYMNRDLAKFMPISFLLMALIVYLLFRNLRFTLVAALNILMCMVWTMGMFAPLGVTMNVTTSIIPPLIAALATAVAIHVLSWYRRQVTLTVQDKPLSRRQLDTAAKKAILKSTFQNLITPTFLTSFTTAIGFGSVIISRIIPIRYFGTIAPVGMFFCFFITLVFLPAALSLLPAPLARRRSRFSALPERLMSRLANMNLRYYRVILLITILVIAGSLWSARNIRVETDNREMFHHDTPVYRAFEFMDEHLAGVSAIEISVRGEEEEAILDPAHLESIEKLSTFLYQTVGADKVLSVNDFLKEMNKSFHNESPDYYRLPASKNMASQYLLLFNGDDIGDYIDDSYARARITARLSDTGSRELREKVRRVQAFIADNFADSDLDIRVTGRSLIELKMLHELVNGQIRSLGLAALFIFAIMFVVLRSSSLGLISIVPNLFPIALNLGIMAWLDIPLDASTAVISTVAIGIAVDDTIHFLYHYKEEMQRGISTVEAIRNTFAAKGPAMLFTTLVITLGFSILLTSNFAPVSDFGLLTALTMVNALIGDLLVLPSLLAWLKPMAHRAAAPSVSLPEFSSQTSGELEAAVEMQPVPAEQGRGEEV